jgi:hypothetical protein
MTESGLGIANDVASLALIFGTCHSRVELMNLQKLSLSVVVVTCLLAIAGNSKCFGQPCSSKADCPGIYECQPSPDGRVSYCAAPHFPPRSPNERPARLATVVAPPSCEVDTDCPKFWTCGKLPTNSTAAGNCFYQPGICSSDSDCAPDFICDKTKSPAPNMGVCDLPP